MQFTVKYEDGVWSFTVESTDDDNPYMEEFELTDLAEARDTAWDLVEELTKNFDDFPDDLFKELDEDGE